MSAEGSAQIEQQQAAIERALQPIAQRLWRRALREHLVSGACIALAGALGYQLLRALAPQHTGLARALLFAGLAAAVAWVLWRARQQVNLARAAAEADERANLKDELKSAYWFLGRKERSPLIEVLLRRADATVQRLSTPEVVPSVMPKRAGLAVALALLTGLLAWWSPQLQSLARTAANTNTNGVGQSEAQSVEAAAALKAQVAKQKERERADKLVKEAYDAAAQAKARAEIEARLAAAAAAAGAAKSEAQALAKGDDSAQWSKLESALKGMPDADAALAAAIKSRDAKRAAQLLEELERKHQLAQADLSLQPKTDLPFGDRGEGFVPKLQDLFQQGDDPFADPKNLETADDEALRKATNAAQRLDENTQSNERNRNLRHEEAYSASISRDSVIEASRYGQRDPEDKQDARPSEETGATVMKGGVMHRRAAMTRGDPDQDGGSRVGEADGEAKADPMLGKQTERLDTQLKRVDIEAKKDKDETAEGDPDKFFAATRQQEAKIAQSDVARRARYVSEGATSGERVPLAYRETVKDYFVNLRQKEK